MARPTRTKRFARLRKRHGRKPALSKAANAKPKSHWWNRAIRFGWLGWRVVAGSILVASSVISFLAFRQTQIQNRAWVSATSAQTSIAVVPMGGTLVFFGTTVTLHNSGHQPALKTYMANRFFSTRTKPKVIVSYEEKLCHELDHDIAGGQVIFPGASTDVPINDGGISLKDVGDTQSLSGEILVGCVSYADPSDGWHFLNGTKRHTTGFVFNVQTKSPIKGMYGFVPIDKTTPGSEIIYTPGVIQEGTAD